MDYTWPQVGSGLPWWSYVRVTIQERAGVHQEKEGGEESVLEPWHAFSLSSRATGTHLELHRTVEVNPQHLFDGCDDVLLHSSSRQHYKPKPTTKRSLVSLWIMWASHFWSPKQSLCSAKLWQQLPKSFCKIRPRLRKNRGTAVDLDIPRFFSLCQAPNGKTQSFKTLSSNILKGLKMLLSKTRWHLPL